MILAPSILAADFGRLADQIAAAERGGAGVIHVDVMDGHFVPNLTVGPAVTRAVRAATRLPVDVHLMLADPDRYVDVFADAGADWISVHVEASPHLQRTLTRIRQRDRRPGIVLNPGTPIAALDELLPDADYVLVMSVNPGFGGQEFIASTLDKIRRLHDRIRERGLDVEIEVDGGVDAGNARQLVEAGARILVAGSAVFRGGDPEHDARRLIEAVG